MNNGGLIEGIKKCYKGKNLAKKHGFLYLLALIITFPVAYATIKTGGNEAAVNQYLVQNPLFLIMLLVPSIIFGLYFIKFLHNSIKLFIWQDTQKDQERVNAMEIMPEVNGDIFKNFGAVLQFGIVWTIMLALIILVLGFLCMIPGINLFCVPVALIIIACILYTMPYIIAGFARNYTTKGNCIPFLLFTLVPKVFVSATILGLKYIVFAFCWGIIQVIIIGILTGLLAVLKIYTNPIGLSIIAAIFVYMEFILTLVFYYAVANIYYRKIELEREI